MAPGNPEQQVDTTEVNDNEISEALPPAIERITVVPKGTNTSPTPSTPSSSVFTGRHGVAEVIGVSDGEDEHTVRQFEQTQQAKKGKFAYLKSRQFWYCKRSFYYYCCLANLSTGLYCFSLKPSLSVRLERTPSHL